MCDTRAGEGKSRRGGRGESERRASVPLAVLSLGALLLLIFGAWYVGERLRAVPASHFSAAEAQAARDLCETHLTRYTGAESPVTRERNPAHASLLAAYPSKASAVAAEEERRRGQGFRSPFRNRSPDEFEAVCFFDADALGPGRHVEPDHIPPEVYQRLEVVLRSDGAPYILQP
jgi:hypothetical protein